MSKKTQDDKAVAKVADRDVQTTDAATWSDWFDHWPEMFARRWPESFRNMPFGAMPFGGDPFRMEQFTDDDGTIVVRAELPGIDPDDDVEITIAEGRMTISGERREHTETDDQQMYRSEFRYGSFSRTIPIPSGACLDDVTATYRDGILEVRVPVDDERPTVTKVPISPE